MLLNFEAFCSNLSNFISLQSLTDKESFSWLYKDEVLFRNEVLYGKK